MICHGMTRPRKPRPYPSADSTKRHKVLVDAGLDPAPPLTAWQLGKLYGLERLAVDTEMAPSTLRRALLGIHNREPIESLATLAGLPGWRKVPGAPITLDGWRALWASAHAAATKEE